MEPQNTNPKLALIDRLHESKNILVTVSSNPSVDQLAACLGLTLWLNKLEKHATAVFSGDVPSTLEFLQPEETLEKNTDSLRDFIISLDKSKADKLRYKVEENVVKIFITPYRTSLSADDLEYSQGDFNVDTIIALGVNSQADLDTAITAHGRILHDATVVTITTGDSPTELGSIQWHDPNASSLCELVVDLGNGLDKTKLDNQIATALLTGVVAQTDRFSNEKTTPQTMSVSAELMSAGANQQLVVSKLEEPAPVEPIIEEPIAEEPQPEEQVVEEPKPNDGSLEIEHDEPVEETSQELFTEEPEPQTEPEQPAEQPQPEEQPEQIEEPAPDTESASDEPQISDVKATDIDEAPKPEEKPPVEDAPLLDHNNEPAQQTEPQQPTEQPDLQPAPPSWMPEQPWLDQNGQEETLAQIEQAVDSPHVEQAIEQQESTRPDLDDARDEVMKALQSTSSSAPQEPVQALNAQPIDLTPPAADPAPMPTPDPVTVDTFVPANTQFDPASFGLPAEPAQPMDPVAPLPTPVADPNQPVDPSLTGPVEQPMTMPLPPAVAPQVAAPAPFVNDPNSPPPVPPPFMPGPPQN
jgi:hypothetical protein